MTNIFRAMMAAAEKYVGSIETAEMKRREPGKPYTHDRIEIGGITNGGRKFTLELTMEDKDE